MFIRVVFDRFFGVSDSVHRVAMSNVRVMAGRDVIAVLVMASGFAMMPVVMMLGGFQMMFNAFVLGHVVLLIADVTRRTLRRGEEWVKA